MDSSLKRKMKRIINYKRIFNYKKILHVTCD